MTDLKPSNVMLERLGGGRLRPVVMDFGLARDSGSSVAQGLTESGAVIGTPAYMSPEQARGEARRLDRRSDVYSLGATLYDLLSGKPPFQDETVVNLLIKVMNDTPTPLRSHLPDVPEALDLIVSKCLNKEAEQRYPTALALAQDLERFLSAGRVEARRLGYLYRLRYWSKRNRALSALALALIVGGLGSIAVFVRNHLQNLRREAEAKAEAALAQTLGQSVKDLEWLVRTAYLLPLHDTSYEKGLVRSRMADIHKSLQTAGEKGVRLGAYVLGRGHLALHEWDAAYEQLSKAERLGYRDAELDYALGRVLGEKYSRALDEARKSGDKSFVEKRKKELEQEFLFPARSYLSRSRGQTTESPNYVEALLDFYNDHHDAALLNAHMARKQAPWLYEAAKLEGDVHMLRALAQRDHGDSATAEKSFALAVSRYEEAAAIGHSDHHVHEALSEAWIRQEEMDLYRGIDPTPKMEKALTAAGHAIEAAPTESYGHTKKAFAYDFVSQYRQLSGNIEEAQHFSRLTSAASEQAIAVHSNDAYAFESFGNSQRALAEIAIAQKRDPAKNLRHAYSSFNKALSINQSSPWFLNDYAGTLKIESDHRLSSQVSARELLDEIYALCSKAIQLDPAFVNGHITLYTTLSVDLDWAIEHGIPFDGILIKLEHTSKQIKGISPDHLPQQLNEIFVHQYKLRYAIDTNNGQSSARASLEEATRKLAAASSGSWASNIILLRSYLLLAQAKLSTHESPAREIQTGLGLASTCTKEGLGSSDCLMAKAHLEALMAADLQYRRMSSTDTMEAFRLALFAAAADANLDRQALLSCAESTALLLNSHSGQTIKSRSEMLKIGIQCAHQAIGQKPGWPRAKALYGVLLLFAAKLSQEKATKAKIWQDAQENLASALRENGNLRHQFGEFVQELATRGE